MATPPPQTTSTSGQLSEVIAKKNFDVPVLPDVAHKVLLLAQDRDSDSSQLAKVIQTDPTLGGHVIQIANSAAYTPNSNLVSLQQAITRLGMIEIRNIAISTSLNSKLFKAPGYEKQITLIWKHSLTTAVWSKEIARKLRTNVEAAFLCGLLHSIGKPVILQTLADLQPPNSPVIDGSDLQQLFSEYESTVAAVVAEKWDLPNIVAEAITYYRNFHDAPTCSEIAATILFGNQIASHMMDPEQFSLETVTSSATLEVINLYPDEVMDLLENAEKVQSAVEALSL